METPTKDSVLTSFHPKTELGKKLTEIRKAYVKKGGKLLDQKALETDVQKRRG